MKPLAKPMPTQFFCQGFTLRPVLNFITLRSIHSFELPQPISVDFKRKSLTTPPGKIAPNSWLNAVPTTHPKNKMITGPYERFRIMIYGQQYRSLLNHDSHKINLIINTNIKYIFKVEILNKDKNLLFYEWHVEKGSEKNCNNCWFTSVVSAPIDQGNTI